MRGKWGREEEQDEQQRREQEERAKKTREWRKRRCRRRFSMLKSYVLSLPLLFAGCLGGGPKYDDLSLRL